MFLPGQDYIEYFSYDQKFVHTDEYASPENVVTRNALWENAPSIVEAGWEGRTGRRQWLLHNRKSAAHHYSSPTLLGSRPLRIPRVYGQGWWAHWSRPVIKSQHHRKNSEGMTNLMLGETVVRIRIWEQHGQRVRRGSPSVKMPSQMATVDINTEHSAIPQPMI